MLGESSGPMMEGKCAEPDFKELAAATKRELEIRSKALEALRGLVDIGYQHSLSRDQTVFMSAMIGDLLVSVDKVEQRYLEQKKKSEEG